MSQHGFFVYILKCVDGSYYTGHSDNLEKRISEHNQGLINCYTSTRLPVECVFIQTCTSSIEALEAEHKIKKWTRRKKEALIKGDWKEISRLSKNNQNN